MIATNAETICCFYQQVTSMDLGNICEKFKRINLWEKLKRLTRKYFIKIFNWQIPV